MNTTLYIYIYFPTSILFHYSLINLVYHVFYLFFLESHPMAPYLFLSLYGYSKLHIYIEGYVMFIFLDLNLYHSE